MKKQIALATLVLSVLSSPLSSLAQSRSGGGAGVVGTGGDPVIGREEDLKELIEGSLRDYLEMFLREGGPSGILDSKLRVQFETWQKAPDAIEDLRNSPYTTDGGCRNKKGPVPASTPMNKKLHKICFDPEMLANRNTSTAEMVGVAIHEHAHHFGIADESHALQRYARDWWTENGVSEERTSDTAAVLEGVFKGSMGTGSVRYAGTPGTRYRQTTLRLVHSGLQTLGSLSGNGNYESGTRIPSFEGSVKIRKTANSLQWAEIRVPHPSNKECSKVFAGTLALTNDGSRLAGVLISSKEGSQPCGADSDSQETLTLDLVRQHPTLIALEGEYKGSVTAWLENRTNVNYESGLSLELLDGYASGKLAGSDPRSSSNPYQRRTIRGELGGKLEGPNLTGLFQLQLVPSGGACYLVYEGHISVVQEDGERRIKGRLDWIKREGIAKICPELRTFADFLTIDLKQAE